MLLNRNKISKLYIKFVIKSPVVIIIELLITFSLLYYFAVASAIDVYQQFDGQLKVMKSGDGLIEVQAEKKYSGLINKNSKTLWYVNKNEAVYKANISEIRERDEGKILTIILPGEQMNFFTEPEHTGLKIVKVDICTGSESLLDRLFFKKRDR